MASERETLLRKAEQHDNAAFLAFSKGHDTEAEKLWRRRDEYLDRARNLPLGGPTDE